DGAAIQEAARGSGEAGHGAAAQDAAHGAEEAAHGSDPLSAETMLHHIEDARTLDFAFFEVPLPSFEPLHTPALEVDPLGVLGALQIGPISIPGLEIDLSITKHVLFLFLASLLTVVTMWLAAREARDLQQGEEPPGGLLNAMEAFYLYLRDDVALANIGRGGERFVPLVIALFFFILYANLLGLVPFGATATSNIMVTGALALVSLVAIEVAGLQELGPKGWLKTVFHIPEGTPAMMKPVLLPIFTVVEIIGKLTKPFALAIRLFANMTAGHIVLLSLLGLIVAYGSFGAPTGVTAVAAPLVLGLFIMFLEIFVAFLQAYIFAILTAVFIGLIRHAH
ncbi:MAG: F0F1 ATP synthase subunit A, partial [Gemmatimonadota bacterium]